MKISPIFRIIAVLFLSGCPTVVLALDPIILADISAAGCRSAYEMASKDCEKEKSAAEAEYASASQKLEAAKSSGTIAVLDEAIQNARTGATKLEQVKARCKKLATASTNMCGSAQAKINEAKTQFSQFAMMANKTPEKLLENSQALVHNNWWKTDDMHSTVVPRIQQQADSLRSQADALQAQRDRIAATQPAPGGQQQPGQLSADQRGATPANANAQPQNPPAASAAAAQPAAVASAGSPTTAAAAEAPQNLQTIAGLAVMPDGSIKGDEDIATAPQVSGSLVDHTVTSEMIPLEKKAQEAAAPAAISANDPSLLSSKGATPPKENDGPEAKKAMARTVSAASSGSSGGGGISLPPLSFSAWGSRGGLPASALGDRAVDAKQNPNGVDLSQFLPGQKRGPASLAEMGIHGPNVNFFSKVNERYHSLLNSLEP